MRKGLVFLIFVGLLMVPLGLAWGSSGEEDLRALVQELLKEVKELKKENAELRSELEKIKAQRAPAPAQALITAPSQKKHSFFSKGGYGSSPSGIDFYGFFKIDAVWQDNTAIGDVYVLVARPEDGDNKFTLNYRQSRFGFDFWKTFEDYKAFGKIEMDFYYAYTDGWNDVHSPLRARRVFAGIQKGTWQFLAGLDWQTISQLAPHTLNFVPLGYMGNPAFRMTQVRLTKWFQLDQDSRLKVQVAAEQPYGLNDELVGIFDDDPANDAGFPGIEGRIAYETKLYGLPALVALWGHYSQEEYDIKSGEEDADSYSLGVEFKFPLPIPFFYKAFLSGEIWTGSNIDRYYMCGVNQGVVFIYNGTGVIRNPDLNQVTDVEEIEARGAWIELELFLTPKLVTHFGWGIDNPDDGDLRKAEGDIIYQQQTYFANVLYRLNKAIAVGAEYMYVDADYRNPTKDGELNRFMASFYYFF